MEREEIVFFMINFWITHWSEIEGIRLIYRMLMYWTICRSKALNLYASKLDRKSKSKNHRAAFPTPISSWYVPVQYFLFLKKCRNRDVQQLKSNNLDGTSLHWLPLASDSEWSPVIYFLVKPSIEIWAQDSLLGKNGFCFGVTKYVFCNCMQGIWKRTEVK